MKTVFVAVGNDGTRPVVWGLGETEEDALAEARDELREQCCVSPLDVHPITEVQAEAVRAGSVAWPLAHVRNR